MTRVLLISQDVMGKAMAGPGIRYFNLARVLAPHVQLTLAIPDTSPPDALAGEFAFEVVRYTSQQWPSLAAAAAQAEVIIFPSDLASEMPELSEVPACLVIDGYDPLLAEWLFVQSHEPLEVQQAQWHERMRLLTRQYLVGDFYLCASERQRDWWLGLLEAHGRISPRTFRQDPTLRSLIDVVPFGLPSAAPRHAQPVIKGVWDGIGVDDKLVLWGGGLWPWLDPLTAIRAIDQVRHQRHKVRLVFPGTRHPNPILAGLVTYTQVAKDLAATRGLLDRHVFFGDWLPYEDWPGVLLESDVALSLHTDTLEARLAFRSRILEYIWAGLPTVATQGDATSDRIAQMDLGVVVGYQDVDAVAAAIVTLLDEPRALRQPQFTQTQHALTWEKAAAPLIAFCQHPRRAADRAFRAQGERGMVAGNPFYEAQGQQKQTQFAAELEAARQETHRWQELAQRYEQGRFMKLMRWVKTGRT